jgi:hypothetical protein
VGELEIAPFPVFVTFKAYVGIAAKFAEQLFAAPIATVTVVFVPLHAPPQPVKLKLLAGEAVKVIFVPVAKFSLQSEPQLIPAGELELA